MEDDGIEHIDRSQETPVVRRVAIAHGTLLLREGRLAAAEAVLGASVGVVPVQDVFGRGGGV